MTAEEFFLSIAMPTVEEFLPLGIDIRRGFLAAIVLNQLVDYWDQEHGPTKNSATQIRDKLAAQSPAFGVVRDVADAAKHAVLRAGPNRVVLSSDQISAFPGLFNAPFGGGVFAEAAKVIVELNDGTTVVLHDAVEDVMAMWKCVRRDGWPAPLRKPGATVDGGPGVRLAARQEASKTAGEAEGER